MVRVMVRFLQTKAFKIHLLISNSTIIYLKLRATNKTILYQAYKASPNLKKFLRIFLYLKTKKMIQKIFVSNVWSN